MLHSEYFPKTLHFSRNRDFYLFLGGFVWGLYGGGLTGKCQCFVWDLSFWPALRTPWQISQKVQGTHHLLCAFWTAGFTAGMVYPNISGIESNNCVYFKAVCQVVWWLYGARQRYEPNFLCANPPTVLRVFLDASQHSAFTHVVFFPKKVNINETIRGGSFVEF